MKFSAKTAWLLSLILLFPASFVEAQSRNNAKAAGSLEGTIMSIIARREKGSAEPIKPENISLYENDVEQKINNLSFDPSPAKIVLLVDNSQTVPAEVEKLQKAVMEFSYEIFEGDQLFVVAFDEKAEIIQEWTDDAKKLEASLTTFRKQGNPYLFDALSASVNEILLPLMPGTRKTVIVLIGDGLDRGSKKSFDKVLGEAAKSKHRRLHASNERPNRRRVSPESAESVKSYYRPDGRNGRKSLSD